MKKQQITMGLAHYPGCGFRRYPISGISFLYTISCIRQYSSDTTTTKDATKDDRNGFFYKSSGQGQYLYSPTKALKMMKNIFYKSWYRLEDFISRESFKDPYPELRIAVVEFYEPYLRCLDTTIIALAIMRLLIKYVYITEFKYGKFTIGYNMIKPNGEPVSFIIGRAIELVDESGNAVPYMDVYVHIEKCVIQKAEEYDKNSLEGLYIRAYLLGMHSITDKELPTSDEIASIIWNFISAGIGSGEPRDVRSKAIGKNRKYPEIIKSIQPKNHKCLPFIVADIETLILKNVHVPYAAGLLVVHPGNDVAANEGHIYNYFSEDYSMIIPSFEERSTKMLVDFIERIAFLVSQLQGVPNVYFHNFARFDGILLMKFLATNMVKYSFRPLMRNNKLYQLSVYSLDKKGQNKMLFRLRDSYTLLPNSLEKLAKTLCPHLGEKGSIVHDEVQVSSLQENSAQLLDYMSQDIRLLGGVMLRAQEIYWRTYNVDIGKCLTLSSLAMNIYRTRYYDQEGWPIYIPSCNQDAFIRRGYYGGHADTYKPYGENLYYYDVNSLYPFVMKTFAMPGGKPVWHSNLEDLELDEIFGFIEAYVICPSTINRPFLPYKNKDNTLLFPTGQFVGVYYSEELKYARDLGYKILPLRGYLFEKMSSPFESFVSDLFACRQDAKIRGDEAMAYVYKILMNTLYGRFGINPESTITEVCKKERYDYLIQKANIISGNKLSDHYFMVSYHSHTGHASNSSDWKLPTNSAVQLSAAITACARIHMYKYISRPDCYYTDTDSAILGNPLPEDEISSIELGKLKQEHIVKKAYFLAPKSYTLLTSTDDIIIKHKGLAKNMVDYEWFVSQYTDLSRTKQGTVESSFRIDWHTLEILKKSLQVNIGIKVDNKREPVFDDQNKWVDTEPKCIIDFGGEESTILKYDYKNLQDQNASMLSEISILQNKAKERDNIITHMESEIAILLKKDQEKELDIARMDSEIAILRKKDQEKEQYIARMESEIKKLREEINNKHPESAVMNPVTPPTVNKEESLPTSNNMRKDKTSNTSMSPKYNITFTGKKRNKRKRKKKR